MRKPKPINFDNLDLIGKHYRLPGSITPCVVEDISDTDEGTLRAVNCLNFKPFDVPAATVRWALDLAASRSPKTAPASRTPLSADASPSRPPLDVDAGAFLESAQ